MTTEQERIQRDLRKGCLAALEGVPEERHSARIIGGVKATDILALCDAIDTLRGETNKGA